MASQATLQDVLEGSKNCVLSEIPLGSTIAYRAEHQILQIVVFRNVFMITLYTNQD